MKKKKKREDIKLDRKVITNVDTSSINFDEMASLMFKLILESEGVNYYEEVRFTKTS